MQGAEAIDEQRVREDADPIQLQQHRRMAQVAQARRGTDRRSVRP